MPSLADRYRLGNIHPAVRLLMFISTPQHPTLFVHMSLAPPQFDQAFVPGPWQFHHAFIPRIPAVPSSIAPRIPRSPDPRTFAKLRPPPSAVTYRLVTGPVVCFPDNISLIRGILAK